MIGAVTAGLCKNPGEGDLCRLEPAGLRKRDDTIDYRFVFRTTEVLDHARACSNRAVAAGEKAAGKRAIRNNPDTLIEAKGKHFALFLPIPIGPAQYRPLLGSQGGPRMLTRSLAAELAPKNIQVNGIGPGYFRTEMNRPLLGRRQVFKLDRGPRSGRPLGTAQRTCRSGDLPRKRRIELHQSSYINGQIIFVDGGLSISV